LNGGFVADHVFGGPGNDRIDAIGGDADVIDCGAGFDRVQKDRRDRVRRCEVVNGRRAATRTRAR
jgi:hypothetical protein